MKNQTILLLATLALSASPWITTAQDSNAPAPQGDRPPRRESLSPGGPGRFQGQRPMVSPVIIALDANHDGVIDEQEIENASKALKSLDKNGDGKLTREELRPPRPEGPGVPGGGRPPRGPAGPGLGRGPDGPPPPQAVPEK